MNLVDSPEYVKEMRKVLYKLKESDLQSKYLFTGNNVKQKVASDIECYTLYNIYCILSVILLLSIAYTCIICYAAVDFV